MGKKASGGLSALAVILVFALLVCVAAEPVCAQAPAPPGTPQVTATPQAPVIRWDLAIAIAVSIGLPCLAAGYAVGKVGAAALGAASERPELLARGLLFVALAEGIAIYGVLMAVLLLLIKF